MNSKTIQLLALYVLKTTLKQCENLTQAILLRKLQISASELDELLQMLHDEHVISYKYTFECPHCGEMNTLYEYGTDEDLCYFCQRHIDTKNLIAGATVRYVLDRDDFIEFMSENYNKELLAAQSGELAKPKVIQFTQNSEIPNEENDIMQRIADYRLFISHSSKDIEYVEAFVEFLEAIGLSSKNVFCSSVKGYNISWGNNIYDCLANEFSNPNKNLIVLFMLSKNYYESVPCLNEMGATWVSKKEYRSILLPGFEYNKIEGAIDPNRIGIKFDDPSLKYSLNEIKEQMTNWFDLDNIDSNKWDRIRDGFIEKINSIMKNPK